MIIVVEVTSPRGYRACKEYKVASMSAAILLAERELRNFPGYEISDMWKKEDPRHKRETSDDW